MISVDDLKMSALEFVGQLARGDFAGATSKFDGTSRAKGFRSRRSTPSKAT